MVIFCILNILGKTATFLKKIHQNIPLKPIRFYDDIYSDPIYNQTKDGKSKAQPIRDYKFFCFRFNMQL